MEPRSARLPAASWGSVCFGRQRLYPIVEDLAEVLELMESLVTFLSEQRVNHW